MRGLWCDYTFQSHKSQGRKSQGHKSQGDWLAALGVTLRAHHLTWVSMRGPSKRDFPASVGYQSPWYEEYSLVESHSARLNTALTCGKAVVRIGVIHPLRTTDWLLGHVRLLTLKDRNAWTTSIT
ncbi:unnamed protein product [Kuraishia capsulata CBS 1993]|uniref:Uncharacterized protein n=1 Tax=Kuraishia capsulata CBS 1993 TaxID=1382522 RepID=W6MS32_9ASCO|nr:uncharacterized protein KUCA_T00003992001 [Kuraishia capsulata CBS 1993]CDK28012.1 unnamed protein product [Kuraishia capsulata CBS 1993]